MANIKVETKNQLDIGKKPRVYFTCHPDDFEKYFKKICDDIFKTHDCAIYYKEDMTEAIAEDEKETDLGRNNLFVIPVTFKLLSTPNRTMDEDFRYAIEKHIPVLPIMMETGLDELYSKSDKFGELQYLNPYSTDPTEILYEKKLKKYLESILISDEMAQRVRAAFDAYIFLSYRKKDRVYANQLMKLIHSNPECRDIAIWFDEFLTPGESFKEGIDKILHNSQLFTLLVTPNLLEEPNGEPNFVMGEEYPAAQKSGINILPAEMVETDKVALKEKYIDIPECVKPEGEEFYAQLLDSVTKIATQANNTPEHNFLIGLAYLDGIDVEVNREFALELITSAAEAGLPEATEKLRDMYLNGAGVPKDNRKALIWGEKYADYAVENYGEEDQRTLVALTAISVIYIHFGEYEKSLEINQNVYKILCDTVGEESSEANLFSNILAGSYMAVKDYDNALKLLSKSYELSLNTQGEENPATIATLNLFAQLYVLTNENEKALEMSQKAYTLGCKIMSEDDPIILFVMQLLSTVYYKLGDFEKAVEYSEKIYSVKCGLYGEDHPDTFRDADDLILCYAHAGEFKKAEELNSKLYAYCRENAGAEAAILRSAYNSILIDSWKNIKNDTKNKEIEAAKKAYTRKYAELGEEHIETISALNDLAFAYGKYVGYNKEAINAFEKLYPIQCKVLGETHKDTLVTLFQISHHYGKLENYEKAIEISEKLYNIKVNLYGKYHSESYLALMDVAKFYGKTGNTEKEAELKKEYNHFFYYKEQWRKDLVSVRRVNRFFPDIFANSNFCRETEELEATYTERCNTLGEEHPDTLKTLSELACVQTQWSDFRNATKPSDPLFFIDVAKPQYLLDALELNKKAYELMCKVLGEENPDTLKQLSSLAYTYSLLEDIDKDIELQEKLYELCCKVWGDKHPDTIVALANVAYSYDEKTDKELKNFNKSSLDFCEMKNYPYIPETALTYFGSGSIYNHETMLENKKKLYNIFSEILGEEHTETIEVKNTLALEYATNRQYQNAAEIYESIYAFYCKTKGETHTDTLEISGNLAYVQMKLKNYEKAIEMLEKLYTVQCDVSVSDRYAPKRTLKILKQAFALSGRSESFDLANEEVYRLQCSVLGEYHRDTYYTIKELIKLYREKNDYKNEIKYREKLYTLCCKVFGEEDIQTLDTLKALAYCYCNSKNLTQGIALCKKVYKLYCKKFGDEHPDTLSVLHSIAYYYGELGDRKKEMKIYEILYPLRCKVLGEEHANTLVTLNNLAYRYKEEGNLKKALELYEKVYSGRINSLGKDHEYTIKTAERIEEIKKLLEE